MVTFFGWNPSSSEVSDRIHIDFKMIVWLSHKQKSSKNGILEEMVFVTVLVLWSRSEQAN